MAVDTAGQPRTTSFELKSAQLPVVAVVLKTADMATLAAELAARLGEDPSFFDNDPVLIDLAAVRDSDQYLDFAALSATLRRYRTRPVAVRGGNPTQMEAARRVGLVAAPEAAQRPAAAPVPEVQEVVREVQAPMEVPVPGPGAVMVTKPLRSGQQVYARGADLVVMAVVNFGAEVIADGHVHVYAPLRGKAIAGARGNADARIFTTCLEAQLIAIAGIYRTSETALPDRVAGRAAHIRLQDEKLVMEPVAS
jgi:septum site-determining protein MinC